MADMYNTCPPTHCQHLMLPVASKQSCTIDTRIKQTPPPAHVAQIKHTLQAVQPTDESQPAVITQVIAHWLPPSTLIATSIWPCGLNFHTELLPHDKRSEHPSFVQSNTSAHVPSHPKGPPFNHPPSAHSSMQWTPAQAPAAAAAHLCCGCGAASGR